MHSWKNSVFRILLFFLLSLSFYTASAQGRYTISGFVYEQGTRETMLAVNVYAAGTTIGTVTNNYGFYSLTLPQGEWEITFSFVGYQTKSFKVTLDQRIELNVELESSLELAEVEVYGHQSNVSSRSAQTSVVELPIQQIKNIPALLGEKDALKVVQLMPGVQKGAEGSSGFYVRGGGPDQNLIILDDAPVYNAHHLFGFFSLFNGDAIKNIELTKGGFPARYGGRLSSVLDITMKDGNKQKFSGDAGIGLISSRLLLEGPIVKDKSSFLVTGRRTYLDLLLQPFLPEDVSGGAFFYDLNAKVNLEINPKNRIYLSSYMGRDKFYGGEDESGHSYSAGLFWDNAIATVRWNQVINHQLFSNLSLIFSNYRLKIYMKEKYFSDKMELSYRSGIRDYGVKYDFSWLPLPAHTVRFGISSMWHEFTPSAVVYRDDFFNDFEQNIQSIYSLETGLYAEDEIKIYDKGVVNLGARLISYNLFDGGSLKLEPRVSGSAYLTQDLSAKASYAQMNQHIHLLSSTGVGLPTDLWVPATKKIPAQESWQVATGLVKDITKYSTTVSIEGYYKKSDNVIAYRDGASFLLLDDPLGADEISWEDNVTSGQGWSYGLEFLVHRRTGKLSGWVGYTLSWTQLQFDELNKGEKFYARYDRRHDISVVGIYEYTPGITLSATWVYGTGNAINLPVGTYNTSPHYPGQPLIPMYLWEVEAYEGKNTFRMAPYHRLDIGVQFHKKYDKYERTWEVSVYNAYNRHNPFFYQPGTDMEWNEDGSITYTKKLKQVVIFPIIPSVSWSIKF